MEHLQPFDTIIIGGSYAGLSAAMALGRSLRRVLIIDSGLPCNRQTPHSHNFITHDGETPAAIAAKARQQVLAYDTITFTNGLAVAAVPQLAGFTVETAAGEQYTAKTLLFATGMTDIMPAIPGFAECWGISVLHCPYCHGYEVRGAVTGILSNGDIGFEFGRLIRQWTSRLTIFTNGPAIFSDTQVKELQQRNISIEEKEIAAVAHDQGQLNAIHFTDGSQAPLTALYARPVMQQHCPIPAALQCELTETGLIKVDMMQHSSIPGVYAAGDSTNPFRSLAMAVSTGTMAGAAINRDLILEGK
ncbi:NAD(P)/FAD-dependent oxidoreductase [Chitinophaga agrisoli]|uniref:NAD(P)/FAD-dependent oxidoreductase n=1 Tax=Chitinophaga agrisoli TaxID=2607653 RepID=A0A5B2VMB8_9BACT|nr:NAD(P)/FAD-dependent oxidoreductase [Chitinophaga agrisoli]KAA2239329.1 NAD(P)/FAD-dependent oxidoreductase [Chitinophaga agrisoli]